jgi:glycosyltransferase involved in cell wall biosynthesis
MRKHSVKISVIIPVFNVEKYLRRCLDSVLSQTFTDFEIILVDDCSPDASPEICEEYAQKGSRIKVIHNPQNKGLPQARKVGLEDASGDYILFVDSDDWIENNMLELLYNKAIGDDLDMVYCGFYRNTGGEQEEFDLHYIDDKFEVMRRVISRIHFPSAVWNKLVKHDIYKKIIFPAASRGEDIQISIQVMHHIKKFGYIQKSLYHYCYNDNSICSDNSRRLQGILDLYEIVTWIVNFCYNNYSSSFSVFEPELSALINLIKLSFVLEKSIRDTSRLHELYPASNKQIFNTAWKETLYNKILLFLAVNHFSLMVYFSIDAFNLIKKIVRSIYRILIPANIRRFIWNKRNKEEDL